jgi:hypothetical protein
MLDSGAPSLYNYLVRKKQTKGIMGSFLKDRANDTFEFLETKDYKDYKKEYIDFLQKNAQYFDTYVNLDIINNAEATWKNQLELEACGLKPIPVFHFGSNIKYLYRYLEKGYNYIAMGGFIPNPVSMLQPALDNLWTNVLCDTNGFPKVRVHGFAVTSARLASRYPWYSVDSTSWAKIGIYGAIVVPRHDSDGNWIYDGSPHVIFVSNKSKAKDEVDGKHIDTVADDEKKYILKYLKDQRVPLGKSSFKKEKNSEGYEPKENERWVDLAIKDEIEIIEEQGVSNFFELRNRINLFFFIGLQKSRPGWPWEFHPVIDGFDLDDCRKASEKVAPGLSKFYDFSGSWRLYIAGENPHGVDPNTPRGRSDRDIYDFMATQAMEMNRLVSNYYKASVNRNILLKKELEAEERGNKKG